MLEHHMRDGNNPPLPKCSPAWYSKACDLVDREIFKPSDFFSRLTYMPQKQLN